jgi:hypothetical protein
MGRRPLGRGLWGRSRVRMATILYARVLHQRAIEHQRTQAEKAGFRLDQVAWDEGVSGVSTKSLTDPGPPPVRLAAQWRHPSRALGGSPRKELPGHLRHRSRVHAPGRRHPHGDQRHNCLFSWVDSCACAVFGGVVGMTTVPGNGENLPCGGSPLIRSWPCPADGTGRAAPRPRA